jgi:hypothetical protein
MMYNYEPSRALDGQPAVAGTTRTLFSQPAAGERSSSNSAGSRPHRTCPAWSGSRNASALKLRCCQDERSLFAGLRDSPHLDHDRLEQATAELPEPRRSWAQGCWGVRPEDDVSVTSDDISDRAIGAEEGKGSVSVFLGIDEREQPRGKARVAPRRPAGASTAGGAQETCRVAEGRWPVSARWRSTSEAGKRSRVVSRRSSASGCWIHRRERAWPSWWSGAACCVLIAYRPREAKSAAVEYFLLALYGELVRRPRTPRRLRLAVLLDGAWRLSGSPFLEPLLREGRAFGVAMLLATQLPRDLGPAVRGSCAMQLWFRQTDAERAAEAARAIVGGDGSPERDRMPVMRSRRRAGHAVRARFGPSAAARDRDRLRPAGPPGDLETRRRPGRGRGRGHHVAAQARAAPEALLTDCAETRALLALLVQNEDRASMEVRSLGPRARAACARARQRLGELCDDPEATRPGWDRAE